MVSREQEISFTPETIARLAGRKQLRDGWYRFIVTKVEEYEKEETGNWGFVLHCAPLADPEDAASAVTKYNVRNYVTSPLPNPDTERFPDHVPPDTLGIVQGLFFTLFPDDCPLMPRFDKQGRLWFQGEQVDPEQEDELRQEAVNKTIDKFVESYKELESMVHMSFYGLVKAANGFVGIKSTRSSLPEGETLVSENEFQAAPVVAVKPAPVAAKANGKSNGHAARSKRR